RPRAVSRGHLPYAAPVRGRNAARYRGSRPPRHRRARPFRQPQGPGCPVTPPGPKQPTLLFKLGRIMATPRAIEALAVAGQMPDAFLLRHQTGDWGELSQDDKAANDLAVTAGVRILSAYLTILGE